MKSLEELDRFIAGIVHRWAAKVAGGPQPAQLLEVRRDILADVVRHIEPLGQGKYIFPFNHVELRIQAHDAQNQTLFESAFGEGSLETEIREVLAGAGVRPADLTVAVKVTAGDTAMPPDQPFVAEYLRKPHASGTAHSRPPARLIVLRGQADPRELRIESDRVNIGRMQEVVSESGGLRRRNEVAFADEETSVSREHARIVYEPHSGKFRLNDDLSQRGTSIFREGRRIQVPQGGRGVQLQSGDEIHLGNARLRFEIEAEPA